jgi:hypothetical protein
VKGKIGIIKSPHQQNIFPLYIVIDYRLIPQKISPPLIVLSTQIRILFLFYNTNNTPFSFGLIIQIIHLYTYYILIFKVLETVRSEHLQCWYHFGYHTLLKSGPIMSYNIYAIHTYFASILWVSYITNKWSIIFNLIYQKR